MLIVTLQNVDALVEAVRRRIQAEGLRPFALRTGIPLGQLRSVVQGRASRYTTLEAIAAVMGMQLFIGPAAENGEGAPQLPEEITRALQLPSNASVVDAVGLIEKDAMASQLRDGMRAVQELTRRAAAAAELLPRLAGDSSTPRMMPFAERVRLRADGEVEFEESAHLSIAVAEEVLPPWARKDRLTCVRIAGDSMEPTSHEGDLVVVDRDRRAAVDDQLFVVCTRDDLIVRRARQVEDHWNLVGDNPAHPPRAMAATDVIAGRVAWRGPRGDAGA